MRVAVVSDIHGNLPALEAVAAHLRADCFDVVVNLGDSVSGPLFPRETAQFLMAEDWIHLAGNHERQLLELGENSVPSDIYAHSQLDAVHMDWIATLPHTRPLDGGISLCHGTPSSDVTPLLENGDQLASREQITARLGDTEASLVLCGHSHVPRSVRIDGRLIVNPGSVGLPAYDDDRPFPHVIQTGSPDARYAVVDFRSGAWTVSLISVPYAVERAAAAAEMHGRSDWAVGLRTGFMA